VRITIRGPTPLRRLHRQGRRAPAGQLTVVIYLVLSACSAVPACA